MIVVVSLLEVEVDELVVTTEVEPCEVVAIVVRDDAAELDDTMMLETVPLVTVFVLGEDEVELVVAVVCEVLLPTGWSDARKVWFTQSPS